MVGRRVRFSNPSRSCNLCRCRFARLKVDRTAVCIWALRLCFGLVCNMAEFPGAVIGGGDVFPSASKDAVRNHMQSIRDAVAASDDRPSARTESQTGDVLGDI